MKKKKIVISRPVTDEQFSAEATLAQMVRDRDRLIKVWGIQKYEERRYQLEKYIKEKENK